MIYFAIAGLIFLFWFFIWMSMPSRDPRVITSEHLKITTFSGSSLLGSIPMSIVFYDDSELVIKGDIISHKFFGNYVVIDVSKNKKIRRWDLKVIKI